MSSSSGSSGSIPNDQGLILDRRKASGALAAAGVSFGPPQNARWKLYHVNIKLVTSATAGSRTILVYLTDGTTAPVSGTEGANVITEWVNNAVTPGTGRSVGANTTERYELTTLKTVDASLALIKIISHPVPLVVPLSLFIQDTAAIDPVGDLVTIEALVEEWMDPTN